VHYRKWRSTVSRSV